MKRLSNFLLAAGWFAGALAGVVLVLTPLPSYAVSCTTQAAMSAADRDALLAAGSPLAEAVVAQNFDLLQASLLPAVVADWEGIRGVAQAAKPLVQGGQVQWRTAYLLDAGDLKAAADTQFFCSNADNSVTVTINLRSLPAGHYAVLIGDYPGSALAGQLALILGKDASAAGKWKLGGLFAREGSLEGHDGTWFWKQARDEAKKKSNWAAWFSYDTARWLLLPVDFLSSPNLEKLNREQEQLKSPGDSLPLTVTPVSAAQAGKSWKVIGLRLDTALHTPDLGLTYEGTGLSDPQAARAEAVNVMSGFLHDHPELREGFHGLWAYAEKDGKQSFAIEVAMHDIP